MPRYFFHTIDGDCVRDDLGEELAGDEAAKEEALVVFGELLQHCGHRFWDTRTFSVVATNDNGEVVVTLTAQASTDLPDDDRARNLIDDTPAP
jgi:hypothetical protein